MRRFDLKDVRPTESEDLEDRRLELKKLLQEITLKRLILDQYRKATESDREKLNKEKQIFESTQGKVSEQDSQLQARETKLKTKAEEVERKLQESLNNLEKAKRLHEEALELKHKFEIKLNKINEIARL